MTIKYFEIIGEVIDANVNAIVKRTGRTHTDVFNEVLNYLIANSQQWLSRSQPQIEYQDPLCRIAYLYGIVAANAGLVESVLEQDEDIKTYIDQLHHTKGNVTICSFGGGPGTELLGIAKWLEKRKLDETVHLEFLVADKVSEWVDSWRALKTGIEDRFSADWGINRNRWPISISGHFSPIDVTSIENFGNLGNLFNQDLYIMCYLLSEVFDEAESISDFIELMAESAPEGSRFLFIDRKEQRWKDMVSRIADQAGLALSSYRDTRTSMSTDEQVSHIGEIHAKIGRTPRVTWDAFWVTATK